MNIKISTLCFLFFSVLQLTAQENTKKHQFGIQFGVSYLNFTGDYAPTFSPLSQESGSTFSLGVLYENRLNAVFSIRQKALIVFKQTDYSQLQGMEGEYTTDFATVSFPLHVLMTYSKSKLKPYVLAGGRFEYELVEDRGDLADIYTDNHWSADIGVGMQFEFDRFIMKPEFISSFGLTNMIDEPNFQGDVRQQLYQIRILFQG